MCRLTAYLGPPIFISSLVTEPKHSIIHQSYNSKETEEPLNGDGFGISWYAPQFCAQPAIFKEVSPAWNNNNLKDIARVTKSDCIFAHVRAATVGGQVSRSNCHPFSWNQYSFMHNGTVLDFQKIKRDLCKNLSDEAYHNISGQTDTEHIFALFIDEIKKQDQPNVKQIAQALRQALFKIEKLRSKHQITEPATMNLVVSDGKNLVATRYISSGEESNSLYYLQGKNLSCTQESFCEVETGKGAFLLASEPLNKSQNWQRVMNNNIITVDTNHTVLMEAIK